MSANRTGAEASAGLEQPRVARVKAEHGARELHKRHEEGEDESEVAQFNDHGSGLQPYVIEAIHRLA